MKLATFEVETRTGTVRRIGAVLDEETQTQLVDLTAAYGAKLAGEGEPQPGVRAPQVIPPDMCAFLAEGDRALDAARETLGFVKDNEDDAGEMRGPEGEHILYSLEGVQLQAPLPRPNSLRDFMAIEEHVENSLGSDIPDVWYEMPVFYRGNPDSVVAPDTTVEWPDYSSTMDYELELAAVIGKRGSDIPVAEAEEYIAGYTIFNDFSARDIQMKEMTANLGPAKGKDFANGLGPYLVPAADIDVLDATMTARINGEVWSEGTVEEMYHSFPEIVEHVSQSETLYPGDVLGSGTVGEGCGLELGRWLSDGDTVELTVEGIGTLRHTIRT